MPDSRSERPRRTDSSSNRAGRKPWRDAGAGQSRWASRGSGEDAGDDRGQGARRGGAGRERGGKGLGAARGQSRSWGARDNDSAGGRGADRPGRGGPAGSRRDQGSESRSMLPPRKPRVPEPPLPDEVTGKELDRAIHHQLRTLTKENAEGVARHLVMVGALLAADDLELALAHAQTAARRAGRVPAAREALGMVTYRMGDYARALGEFRTVRRLSGSNHLLPLMVDCERGLGRHARALELAASPEARTLTQAEREELAIVVSGVRRDLDQLSAALLALDIPALHRPSSYRLHYAYADTLLALGRATEARTWFTRAAAADTDGETDALERLDELDGTVVVDLLEDADEDPQSDESPTEGGEDLEGRP